MGAPSGHALGCCPVGAAACARTNVLRGAVALADGRHVLDELVVDGERVAVHGRFTGTLRDGSAAQVGFADFWVLGGDRRATTRRSFFDTPAV